MRARVRGTSSRPVAGRWQSWHKNHSHRSVMAPSCPSPHSHITSHKYTTSPTCQILSETQALVCGYGESVSGGGPTISVRLGDASISGSEHLTFPMTLGVPSIRLTVP